MLSLKWRKPRDHSITSRVGILLFYQVINIQVNKLCLFSTFFYLPAQSLCITQDEGRSLDHHCIIIKKYRKVRRKIFDGFVN